MSAVSAVSIHAQPAPHSFPSRDRVTRWLRGALLALASACAASLASAADTGPTPGTVVPATLAAPPAANRLDAILARGVLRLGTTGDYKPFSYRVGTSDTFVGLDLELAGDLARSLGVTLQVVPTTWGHLMADLEADRFDLAMGGVSITLDRQRRAYFSLPYLRDGKTPIARCTDVARFQTLAQIDQPGVRLVVNPGGTNERFARTHAPHATLSVWPDNVTIFGRIVANEADVMITDAVEARLQQRLHPQLCAVHPEAPFDFSEKAVLLPRDDVLKAYVDQWLHQAIETGNFRRANERWLDYPWGVEAVRQGIEQRLQLAPDVARWKWNHHADIEDAPRERQLIEAMADQSATLGVPRAFAQAFFRAQVEASKTVQHELFMGWQVMKAGTFSDAPDLATVTRPRIDAVNLQLVQALASCWTQLADPERHAQVLRALQPIEAEALSMKAVEQAVAPLQDLRAAGGMSSSAGLPEPGPGTPAAPTVTAKAPAAAPMVATAVDAAALMAAEPTGARPVVMPAPPRAVPVRGVPVPDAPR